VRLALKDSRWVDKALASSRRALELEPDLPEGLAAQARICWSQQRYQEAADYAARAIQRKPACENAYWTLGQVYFTTDRWAEAAALSERAVEAAGADLENFTFLQTAAPIARITCDGERLAFFAGKDPSNVQCAVPLNKERRIIVDFA
jgi:tetratricopeptide (TPR) repeat protein